MTRNIVLLLLSLTLVISCGGRNSSKLSDDQAAGHIGKAKVADTKTAEGSFSGCTDPVLEIAYEWNDAHNSRNIQKLDDLYAPVGYFYTFMLEKQLCLDSKIQLFEKNPDFKQTLEPDIDVYAQGSGYKCSMTKNVEINGKVTQYQSYLYLNNIGGRLKIVREGDCQTDTNIAKRSAKISIPKNCIEGDFDGDGKTEKAWLELMDYENGSAYICFGKSSIPKIKVSTYQETIPGNLSDLNGDGADEIGFISCGAGSAWTSYYVYSFMNGKWCKAIDSFSIRFDVWDASGDRNPVEIAPGTEMGVKVHYTDFADFSMKEKIVPIVSYKGITRRGTYSAKSPAVQRKAEVKQHYDFLVKPGTFDVAYRNNKFAADEKYKGKIIKMSGIIRNIDESFFGTPYISIADGEGLFDNSVQCYFPSGDESKKILSRLTKGQRITVIGRCGGGTSSLENCIIVK